MMTQGRLYHLLQPNLHMKYDVAKCEELTSFIEFFNNNKLKT
jgi:hypothetical protein